MIEKKWSFDWGPLTRRENGREEIPQDRCRKTPRWFPLVTKFWSVTQGRPLRWCAKFGCQRQPSWGFPTTILRAEFPHSLFRFDGQNDSSSERLLTTRVWAY